MLGGYSIKPPTEKNAGVRGPRWICCQIGAREHYAIARGLHRRGRLAHLVTDAWVEPGTVLGKLPGQVFKGLQERYDSALRTASIHNFTRSLLMLEARFHLQQRSVGWHAIMERNAWFQDRVLTLLRQENFLEGQNGMQPVVFAYSYAACHVLQLARDVGCRTVLCQINPGPIEEEIVAKQHQFYPQLQSSWSRAPQRYWDRWRSECELADHIVVNSAWSREALVKVGIPDKKLVVVPLIYERPSSELIPERKYPAAFSQARPLRALFLGSMSLRKGVAQLSEAIRLLRQEPFEFWFVGHEEVEPPVHIRDSSRIRWTGPVPRSETHRYYQQADVFIFPTLSDGFGLTQLEAQGWGLPLISSRFCGEVVEHGKNGLLLEDVTPDCIADTLRWCLQHPAKLGTMSRAAIIGDERFSEEAVISQLEALVDT